MEKEEHLNHLREIISRNEPIIGAAIGSGMIARESVLGGADMILALNAGRLRMAGLPSLAAMLPFGNANNMVFDFATREILPAIKSVPVIFGLCATDPTWVITALLEKVKEAGFAGVTNFPTVGVIDGTFRSALEEAGYSYDVEAQALKKAGEMGLLTIAFAYNEKEAMTMSKVARVDILLASLGFTTGGRLGIKTVPQQKDIINTLNRIIEAGLAQKPDLIPMIYGAHVVTPQDTVRIYHETRAKGYIGGSTIERIPLEATVEATTKEFKGIPVISRKDGIVFKLYGFAGLIGESPAMLETYELIRKVAPHKATVLITGETGTGKDIVARAIHLNSPRKEFPFIRVNCHALSKGVLESELFGHEKGAFTGAIKGRKGRFELANGGTIFLDEITEMPPDAQARLLTAVQEEEIERVGTSSIIKLNIRIITATNRDLWAEVEKGNFREDLYYRLNVMPIHLPPLRERKEDIPLLANHFLKRAEKNLGKRFNSISKEALEILCQYDWPGNVRELENLIQRVTILEDSNEITPKFLSGLSSPGEATALGIADISSEKEEVEKALYSSFWNKTKAAKTLGISRKTLYYKIRKYHLQG